MEKTDFDAVVAGSGPNGLAAAITLQQKGLSVLLIEGKDSIGGGLYTIATTANCTKAGRFITTSHLKINILF